MAQEVSGFAAMVQMKCPRCRQGKLFCNPTSYNFTKLFQMPELCEVCQQRTEPEPGFYYGAMYINYGFSVALLAFCIGVLYAVFDFGAVIVLGTYVTVLLALGPWLFRYARVLYLNMFVHYDKELTEKLNGIRE